MTNSNLLSTLLTRRSVLANNMSGPSPTSDEINMILQAAHRVPDHGKIGPWRFILFKDQSREIFGKTLRERFSEINPDSSEKLLEFEAQRFTRAPLIIAVVSSPDKHHKVPVWEQELSVGAACQNILLACQALNFCAQWLTEWYAFDEKIDATLGLKDNERVAGFMYIGTSKEAPKERVRPDLDERISYWGT